MEWSGEMMKVEIVSRKLIKPSTPTPPHLRNYKLLFVDQLMPEVYVTIILYYYSPPDHHGNHHHHHHHHPRGVQLEKSLSDTLTKFYPLAGRIINDELMVDCNDQGVHYLEAQVSGCELNELLVLLSKGGGKGGGGPPPEDDQMELILDQFVPLDIGPADSLLAVQINNINRGGGLVVGVRVSHKIADASTIATFINGWATASRVGIGRVTCPNLDMAAHLPAIPSCTFKFPPPVLTPKYGPHKLVMKRFVFNGASILALKHKLKACRNSGGGQPTRVMVVTAILWKALICRGGQPKPKHNGQQYSSSSVLFHAMNLRGTTGLLIPENSFGNLVTLVRVQFMGSGERSKPGPELEDLTSLLRNEMSDLKANLATKLRGDEISLMWLNTMECLEGTMEEDSNYAISSWCRFPFYEADFGWGKPSWISPAALQSEVCILMDTKSGDGIEAWVHLKAEDMIQLQRDPDILAYTATATAS